MPVRSCGKCVIRRASSVAFPWTGLEVV